jgi:hypothetical protein
MIARWRALATKFCRSRLLAAKIEYHRPEVGMSKSDTPLPKTRVSYNVLRGRRDLFGNGLT